MKEKIYTNKDVLSDLRMILIQAMYSQECNPKIIKIIGKAMDEVRKYIKQ